MYVRLHYQHSEYDCVPTAVSNAIAYLFEREAVPPMVIRHIYTYTLDTVGRGTWLGRGGTSSPAVQLLGHWLASYKSAKFAVTTRYLEDEEVHLDSRGPIMECLEDNGVALCNVRLSGGEEHFIMAVEADEDWLYCFDSYSRTRLRGLRDQVRVLPPEDGRGPNLAVRREWMDADVDGRRFGLGPANAREALLIRSER